MSSHTSLQSVDVCLESVGLVLRIPNQGAASESAEVGGHIVFVKESKLVKRNGRSLTDCGAVGAEAKNGLLNLSEYHVVK